LLLSEGLYTGLLPAVEQAENSAIIRNGNCRLGVIARGVSPAADEVAVVVVLHHAVITFVAMLDRAVVTALIAHGDVRIAPFIARYAVEVARAVRRHSMRERRNKIAVAVEFLGRPVVTRDKNIAAPVHKQPVRRVHQSE